MLNELRRMMACWCLSWAIDWMPSEHRSDRIVVDLIAAAASRLGAEDDEA